MSAGEREADVPPVAWAFDVWWADDADRDAPLDVLCIAPHRDDAELTCGGTLIRAADLGQRVGVLDLTRGETGTRGNAALRAEEAARAASILGLTVRANVGLPDADITNDRASRTRVVAAVRALRPHVVIAPAARGRHPDHQRAAELARDACFLAGLAKYAPEAGTRHRPHKLVHTIAYREDYDKPTFVVDVSDQFARKLDAIACYHSQFDGLTQAGEVYPNGEPLAMMVTHHAAHYGSLIRCRYGEPYWTQETMRVDDVRALAVATF